MEINEQKAFIGFKVEKRTFTCPIHGEYEENVFIGANDRVQPLCPMCVKEEHKKADEKNAMLYRNSFLATTLEEECGVPTNNSDNSFDNFDAYNESLKISLETAKKFCTSTRNSLVMLGKNGNGKTHLAVSCMREQVIKNPDTPDCLYVKEAILIKEMKATFSNKKYKEADVLRKYEKCSLLVIDEFGRAKDSDYSDSTMDTLISERLENDKLKTIIISNMSKEAFTERAGEWIISRINLNGVTIGFSESDYRVIKRRNESTGGVNGT